MAQEELKAAVKEAAKEWLDDQFTRVGKWTVSTIVAFILVGLLIVAVKFGS